MLRAEPCQGPVKVYKKTNNSLEADHLIPGWRLCFFFKEKSHKILEKKMSNKPFFK